LDIALELVNADAGLRVDAPEGKLTPGLIEELKAKKQEIIKFMREKGKKKLKYKSIDPVEKKEYYPLSSAQKRMYFLQEMNLKSTVYNILNVIPLPGVTGLEKLETTFKKLIHRHESLRTSFEMVEGKPVQRIHREVEFKIRYYNRIDDFIISFNLAQPPLLRVGIIELLHTPSALRGHPSQEGKEDRYLLMIDMHHIISDGISQQIAAREFISLYNNEGLPPLKLTYKDYVQWQKSSVQRQANKKQEVYWLEAFSGEIPVPDLPTDYPRPSLQSFEGNRIFFEIPGKETALLKQMALKKEITLYMILLSQLAILMSKLSGQEDIVIGTPTAGRGHADLENIIGIFINTLAIRNYPAGEKTFDFFLNEVKQQALAAFENQDYLFEDLVEKAVLKRNTQRNPLFDIMFALQNQAEFPGHETAPVKNEGEQTNAAEYTNKVSRFDMSWAAMEIGNCLVFNIEYCTKLFKETTIYRFINYFKRIIADVIEAPGKPISEIEILSAEERKEILIDFNQTKTLYPNDKTLYQLFEEQAEETPDHIAVIMDGPGDSTLSRNGPHVLTYKELNQRAGHLAGLLGKKGFKPGDIAGIMMEPSIRMIAAMLAILKSGGAYLPLDIKSPEERVKYMLTDSSSKILVTVPGLSEKIENLSTINCQLLMVNEKPSFSRRLNTPPKEANSINNYQLTINNSQLNSSSLAYIIYTSGTTGKPKGVMIEHQNVVRLVKNTNYIRWSPGDRLMLTGALVFDITTFEIWGPLLNGLCLFLPEEKAILDPWQMKEMINKHQISILHLIPQLFNQLADRTYEIFAGLRYFLVGGDLVRARHINEIRNRYQELKVLHMYGPTENTTFSTYLAIESFYKNTIPIGKPISNSTVYIIDKYHRLSPPGVQGDLAVGGAGVARGYLNRPELTAEKFLLQRPGGTLFEGTRGLAPLLYRTGDLARWLPDGNIEFLGRIDHQVKIRGQRIELEEIEHQLLAHQSVKEAVVIAKEKNNDQFLCAYIVPGKEFEIVSIKEHLARKLPVYMVPTYFELLESIPLTATGKIDRKALPSPGFEINDTYTPPRNETEKKLVEIWSEVLGLEKEKIGIESNFFEIGGNSLNLIMLVGKINEHLGTEVPIPQIYRNPTIKDITRAMTSKNFSDQPAVLLNRPASRNVFCLPDQLGFGYGYGSLASILHDYALYALSFIEEEDRLSRYVEIITGLQPGGPYVFFGHSAAGRITMEITRTLENLGKEVSDIIFADCFFTENLTRDLEEETLRIGPIVDAFLAEWNADFLKEKIMKKALKHMEYLNRVTKLEKVQANIHLIVSEEARSWNLDLHCWDKLTARSSRLYNGWGRHVEMLWGANLGKNVTIIKKILTSVTL
jgi:amino acid adenylation domain-containing protein